MQKWPFTIWMLRSCPLFHLQYVFEWRPPKSEFMQNIIMCKMCTHISNRNWLSEAPVGTWHCLSHLSSAVPCHSNRGCWHCGRWARWGPAAGSPWGRRRKPLLQSADCSPSRRRRAAAGGRRSSARRLQRHGETGSRWPVRHGWDIITRWRREILKGGEHNKNKKSF